MNMFVAGNIGMRNDAATVTHIPDQQKEVVPEGAPMAFQSAAHEIEQVPGKKSKDGICQRGNEQKGDESPPFTRHDKFRDKNNSIEDEPAGQNEHKKKHLAGDKIDGHVRNGIPAEFFLKGVEQMHVL